MKYEDIVKQVIDNSTDKTLTHYGVLGMRWGYSRGSRVSGTNKAEDYKSPRPQVDLSLVQTEDLQRSISRMQMEKTYNQLMDERYGITKAKEEKKKQSKFLTGLDTTSKVAKQTASIIAAVGVINKAMNSVSKKAANKHGRKTIIVN